MTIQLACACGAVRLEAHGRPIITTECHCTSCREAGGKFAAFDGAPDVRSANGGTPFVMMRKDRVEVTSGREHLKAFRLGPDRTTRRIVATCCNTPVFLEFRGGHWLSIYSTVWPRGAMQAIELRTMTSDLPDPAALDTIVPNAKHQSLSFFAKLLGAWIAMGFRSPKVEVAQEGLLN